MKQFWRAIYPFLQVVVIFFIYFEVANWIFSTLVITRIDHLPEYVHHELEPYLALDYGRVPGRIFRFFWALVVFWGAEYFLHRRSFRESVLFTTKYKTWSLVRGASFGAVMISSLVALSFISGTVDIIRVKVNIADLTATVILYAVCMTITAISEELILRGFIVNTLCKSWGTHKGVWASAALLGLVHLTVSPYYAYTAFVTGILLGYMFIWKGLYYCIGWHFAWDFIESVFYSGKIFQFTVNDPFLAGQKFISPDQEGLLALPVLLIGFAVLLATHKTEWRLQEKKS